MSSARTPVPPINRRSRSQQLIQQSMTPLPRWRFNPMSDDQGKSPVNGSGRSAGPDRTDSPGYAAGDDPRAAFDVPGDSPGREGRTGATPANVHKPLPEGETITKAPNWQPMENQPQWRRDFPVDWPQDHYVARRDFMKFM